VDSVKHAPILARYFTPQFSDRITALSREYGIPEK